LFDKSMRLHSIPVQELSKLQYLASTIESSENMHMKWHCHDNWSLCSRQCSRTGFHIGCLTARKAQIRGDSVDHHQNWGRHGCKFQWLHAGRMLWTFCAAWLAAWLSERMFICADDSPDTMDLPEKHTPPGYLLDHCMSLLHRLLTMAGARSTSGVSESNWMVTHVSFGTLGMPLWLDVGSSISTKYLSNLDFF
jgi:hypothetical protein